jgi:DNA-binding NtrC family response regulator
MYGSRDAALVRELYADPDTRDLGQRSEPHLRRRWPPARPGAPISAFEAARTTGRMEPITLLLAAGDPSLLRGLRMRLEIEPGLAILGEADSLEDVAPLAETLSPDVVVLDADASSSAGATVSLVRSLAATQRVLVVSLHDGRDATAAALEAGAGAFVSKHGPAARLVAAIHDLAPGANHSSNEGNS